MFESNSNFSDSSYQLDLSREPPPILPGTANVVLRAPDDPALPTDTSGIDILRKVRQAMESWTSALGPVEDWPRIFREKYDEACCDTTASSTQAAIDLLLRQVGDHVRIGKSILAGIQECSLVKLPLSQSVEGDRLLAGDIVATLHRGIAILEARLEIHAPSGPHVSDLHSTIRRHREFTDLL